VAGKSMTLSWLTTQYQKNGKDKNPDEWGQKRCVWPASFKYRNKWDPNSPCRYGMSFPWCDEHQLTQPTGRLTFPIRTSLLFVLKFKLSWFLKRIVDDYPMMTSFWCRIGNQWAACSLGGTYSSSSRFLKNWDGTDGYEIGVTGEIDPQVE
jgi:hypothetical protein